MTEHNLIQEFPEAREVIHELKTTNAHFARLFDEYHKVNRQVQRAADRTEPLTDAHETQLHKERLRLKDELYAMITAAKRASSKAT